MKHFKIKNKDQIQESQPRMTSKMWIPEIVKNVTMMPAIITPAKIERNAFLNGNFKTSAAAVPVQAPVSGSGIATNVISAKSLYFSTRSFPCFSTRLKSQSKNLAKSLLCFDKN